MSTRGKKAAVPKPRAKKQVEKAKIDVDLQDENKKELLTKEARYQLANMIKSGKYSKEYLLTQLKSKEWKSWNEFMYSLVFDTRFEINKNLEYELLLNKTVPSVYSDPCALCKSTNTKITGNQERAADEGGTARVICKACGFKAIL